jgi:hypothetical protein
MPGHFPSGLWRRSKLDERPAGGTRSEFVDSRGKGVSLLTKLFVTFVQDGGPGADLQPMLLPAVAHHGAGLWARCSDAIGFTPAGTTRATRSGLRNSRRIRRPRPAS